MRVSMEFSISCLRDVLVFFFFLLWYGVDLIASLEPRLWREERVDREGSCSCWRQQREYESRLLPVGEDVPMIEQCYFKFSVGGWSFISCALIVCSTDDGAGVESTPIHHTILMYRRLNRPTPRS